MTDEIKKQVVLKIENLTTKIEAIKAVTLDESEQAQAEMLDILKDFDGATLDIELLNSLTEKAHLAGLHDERDALVLTLHSDVTAIETRYVITDKKLVSPAGYHPSELVFITNPIMIQVNTLPKHVSDNLYIFDMTKIK